MSKKRKKKKNRERRRSGGMPETHGAKALTLMWMLAIVATAAAQASAGIVYFIDRYAGPFEEFVALTTLAIYVAAVTGVVALICLPFVLRHRRVAPPRAALVFAIVVSVIPMALYATRLAM